MHPVRGISTEMLRDASAEAVRDALREMVEHSPDGCVVIVVAPNKPNGSAHGCAECPTPWQPASRARVPHGWASGAE